MKQMRDYDPNCQKEFEAKVTQFLIQELHMSFGNLGPYYIREALMILDDYSEIRRNLPVTKFLYPEICSRCKKRHPKSSYTGITNPASVERAIRHTIETVWRKYNDEYYDPNLDKLFDKLGIHDKKPSNSEFIHNLYEYIVLNDVLKNTDM